MVHAPDNSAVTWCSGTASRDAQCIVMQHDNNLVVLGPEGTCQWSSGTGGVRVAGDRVVLTDEGRLEISDGAGAPVWTSWTFVHLTTRAAQARSAMSDRLEYGGCLAEGARLVSPNGRFALSIIGVRATVKMHASRLQTAVDWW